MATIRLLGGASIEGPGGPGAGRVVHRARIGLLALLATSRSRAMARERLAVLLWPESDAERARHLLREAVYRLREMLGAGALTSAGAELRLDSTQVGCDLWEFEAASAAEDWEAAERLYTGGFLEGFALDHSSEFEHWLDAERSRLAALHGHALESRAASRGAAGDWLAAATLWKRLAAAEPYNARIVMGLMEALDAAGDRAGALRYAAKHNKLLASELGASPDPGVVALAERLRRDPMPREFPASSPTEKSAAPPPTPTSGTDSEASGGRTAIRRLGFAAVAAGGLLAVLTVGFISWRLRDGESPSLVASNQLRPMPRLMLTDFKVQGADSNLAFPLGEAVRMSLSQSSAVTLLGGGAITSALKRQLRPPDSRIDLALAREIAEREGVAAIVDGEVLRDTVGLGSGFLITLRLVSADSGNLLASVSRTVARPDDLIRAVDAVGRMLRARIGESAKSLRATRPLNQITTTSTTALRLVNQGTVFNNQTRYLEAISLFRQAVALDSEFAEGWRMLAVVMLNSRAFPRSAIDSALTMAYRNRDRTTDREREQLEAFYLISGPHADRGRAVDLLERIVANGDVSGPYVNLLNLLVQRREWGRAATLLAPRLKTNSGIGPNSLGNALTVLFAQGRLAEAEVLLAGVGARLPGNSRYRMESLRLRYHRGEFESFKRELDESRRSQDPDLRARASETAYLMARREGRFGDAEKLWTEARATEAARGFVRPPLEDSIQAAEFDIQLRQEPNRALARLDAALAAYPLWRLDPVDRPYAQLATLYAAAGRPDKGRTLLTQFQELKDTAQTRIREPEIHLARAEIALADGRPQDAIREFRAGYRLSDGPVGDPLVELADLARAFHQAGEADSAIAKYQEFLRLPYWNRLAAEGVHLPEVHQRLAESYAEKGESANAEQHFRELESLFRNADPPQRARVAEIRGRLATVLAKSTRPANSPNRRRGP